MGNKKKISFKLPIFIKHKETRKIIGDIVKKLNDRDMLEVEDIPQLHRMATAYDEYLTNTAKVAELGATMENLKGETVKRPEVNIARECWSQYLELAKEYGLTAKSKGQIKALGAVNEEESPLDVFLKNRK